jgi:hypothetical protein
MTSPVETRTVAGDQCDTIARTVFVARAGVARPWATAVVVAITITIRNAVKTSDVR